MLSMAVTNTMTKSNLVGGMVFLVYVSLLEASLREMRAGTKLSKGGNQGGQLSTALLTLTFFSAIPLLQSSPSAQRWHSGARPVYINQQ